jgi:predicted GIY-YIG superfamily endonuclease
MTNGVVPRTGIIYVATNLETGKQYVGQTNNFKRRIMEHLSKDNNIYFSNSLQKHGLDKFVFMQNIYPKDELNNWEQHWIERLRTTFPDGYNMNTGGNNFTASEETCKKISNRLLGNKNCVGHRHTEEAKRKVSMARKGKKMSEEQKEKLRMIHVGRRASDETKRKMSVAHKGSIGGMLGKYHTEETKKKISDAGRNRSPISKETRTKMSMAALKRWRKT